MLIKLSMSTFKHSKHADYELVATAKMVEEGTSGAPTRLDVAVEEHKLA